MQDEFLRLQQKVQKTIVFVTHDMDEALKFADRVAIMDHGAIVQCDPSEVILRRPANKFVRDFVGTDHTLKQLALTKVKDAMITEVETLQPKNTIAQAKVLFDRGYRSIVIVSETGQPLGYINKEDAIESHEEDPVSEIMVTPISTVDDDLTLKEALSVMVRNDAGYIAVTDNTRALVGIITSSLLHQIVGDPHLDAGGIQ
jgi:osmoprotectant transport system ATP-binding protein